MPACDHVPRKYEGPSKAEILAMRQQFTNPAIFTIYMEPLLIVAMGMVVMLIVLAVLMPIIQLNQFMK